jgi:hypothetical protein
MDVLAKKTNYMYTVPLMTVRTQLVIYIGALYATLNTAQLHAYLLLADHKYSILYTCTVLYLS